MLPHVFSAYLFSACLDRWDCLDAIPLRRILYNAAYGGLLAFSLIANGNLVAQGEEVGKDALIRLEWNENYLTLFSDRLPKEGLKIHYLEAYCRDGSTHRDWKETVIPHQTTLVTQKAPNRLELHCKLEDGVEVDHHIVATEDEVDFQLTAKNPSGAASRAHWAQPCIRVGNFTGKGQDDYVPHCFIVLGGKIAKLPTTPWAEKALYTPGQVYRPRQVDADDVNPRPVSSILAENGLSGVFSADGSMILATAWEPYQELFQGVGVCMHTDFRIGGLAPGEEKHIHGKIYLVPANENELLARFQRDFPSQQAKAP